MAIRIIENGKYNKIKCTECECVFAFDNIDIEENGKVICPQCKTENTPVVKTSTKKA